jgi:hypothetical protein
MKSSLKSIGSIKYCRAEYNKDETGAFELICLGLDAICIPLHGRLRRRNVAAIAEAPCLNSVKSRILVG